MLPRWVLWELEVAAWGMVVEWRPGSFGTETERLKTGLGSSLLQQGDSWEWPANRGTMWVGLKEMGAGQRDWTLAMGLHAGMLWPLGTGWLSVFIPGPRPEKLHLHRGCP